MLALIFAMPPNATYLDTHMAEVLQKLMAIQHQANFVILFTKFDEKQDLIKNMFTGKGASQRLKSNIQINAEINPDSLLYSWGSTRFGKLGISDNYFSDFGEGENHAQFYLNDENDESEQ